MHPSLFLTEDDVRVLTGFTRADKQIKALLKMGIKFTIRQRDGRPVVASQDVVDELKPREFYEPNFSALEEDGD